MSSHSSPFQRSDAAPAEAAPPSAEELNRKQAVIELLKTLKEPTLGNDLTLQNIRLINGRDRQNRTARAHRCLSGIIMNTPFTVPVNLGNS